MLADKYLYRDDLENLFVSHAEFSNQALPDNFRKLLISRGKADIIQTGLKETFIKSGKWEGSTWFEILQDKNLTDTDIRTIETNLLPRHSYGLVTTFGQYNYLMAAYKGFRFPVLDQFLANIGDYSLIHRLLFENEPTEEDIKNASSVKDTIELIASGTIVNDPDNSIPENGHYLVTDMYINDAFLELWGSHNILTGRRRTALRDLLNNKELQDNGYKITSRIESIPGASRPQLDGYEWYDCLTIEHPKRSRMFDIYQPWDMKGRRRPPLIYSPIITDRQIEFIDQYLAHLI